MSGVFNMHGEMRGVYRVWEPKSERKNHMEDPAVYCRIILGCIFG
jgi:hypothetical protein